MQKCAKLTLFTRKSGDYIIFIACGPP